MKHKSYASTLQNRNKPCVSAMWGENHHQKICPSVYYSQISNGLSPFFASCGYFPRFFSTIDTGRALVRKVHNAIALFPLTPSSLGNHQNSHTQSSLNGNPLPQPLPLLASTISYFLLPACIVVMRERLEIRRQHWWLGEL